MPTFGTTSHCFVKYRNLFFKVLKSNFTSKIETTQDIEINQDFFFNLFYDILNLSAIGSEKVSATVLLQILMTCAKIYKKRIAIIALRAKT